VIILKRDYNGHVYYEKYKQKPITDCNHYSKKKGELLKITLLRPVYPYFEGITYITTHLAKKLIGRE